MTTGCLYQGALLLEWFAVLTDNLLLAQRKRDVVECLKRRFRLETRSVRFELIYAREKQAKAFGEDGEANKYVLK